MLIAIIFLSSCLSFTKVGVLPPDFPVTPDFRLSRDGDLWGITHEDKVSLQRWILEVDGYRKDCNATIENLSR
jgi:hypothetical protein